MHNITHVFDIIIAWLIPRAKLRSVRGVVPKLVVAASAYFIWQERNLRLFQKKKRSVLQVIEVITSTVRLKLLSFRYKKSKNVDLLLEKWKLPNCLVRDGG